MMCAMIERAKDGAIVKWKVCAMPVMKREERRSRHLTLAALSECGGTRGGGGENQSERSGSV